MGRAALLHALLLKCCKEVNLPEVEGSSAEHEKCCCMYLYRHP